jgi:hypothetical protein
MALDAAADEWNLPIRGFRVTDVWLSGELCVIAYEDESEWAMADSPKGPASHSDKHRRPVRPDPCWWRRAPPQRAGPPGDARAGPWAPAARVKQASVNRRGILRVDFDGSSLVAGPDQRYENWGLAGPGALILACPPGGGDPRIAH